VGQSKRAAFTYHVPDIISTDARCSSTTPLNSG
ncbi:unnamed protein product, partial [Heterotrigona itama]